MEVHQKSLVAYAFLMNFINEIARDEACDNIKISQEYTRKTQSFNF